MTDSPLTPLTHTHRLLTEAIGAVAAAGAGAGDDERTMAQRQAEALAGDARLRWDVVAGVAADAVL